MAEFRFDPDTSLDLMREEVPACGRLQDAVAAAPAGIAVTSLLDCGTGTGAAPAAALMARGTGAAPADRRRPLSWRAP